jgi:arylsulfatase A-like enzyme
MRERGSLGLVVLATVLCGCDPDPEPPLRPEPRLPVVHHRPNIILILTDDQDAKSAVHMPTVQREVALAGTTMANAFVPIAICCPSRVSILRGQYPHNHGVIDNAGPRGGFAAFRGSGGENATIATWLHDAGYRTALVGKYLNGYGALAPTYVPPGWDHWVAAFGPANEEITYYNYTTNQNGQLSFHGQDWIPDYATDVLAGAALDFVRTAAPDTVPFFLLFAPFAPHEPAVPASRHRGAHAYLPGYPRGTAFDEEDVSDKALDVRRLPRLSTDQLAYIDFLYPRRLDMLLSVDDGINAIVQELARTGELAVTYIFFTSDNGFHMGEHRMPPGKGRAYEEDIRVPFFVRGPGVSAGAIRQEMALSTDLAPTFLDIAGAEVPSFLDGRSLLPLLRGQPVAWRESFLIYSPLPVSAIRTRQYMYGEYHQGERELYDLATDPEQLTSLHASASPSLISALAARLAALRTCVGPSCREIEDRGW